MTSVIPIPGWHHGSATMLHNPDLDPILDGVYVRYWHLADMDAGSEYVRSCGVKRTSLIHALNDPKRRRRFAIARYWCRMRRGGGYGRSRPLFVVFKAEMPEDSGLSLLCQGDAAICRG